MSAFSVAWNYFLHPPASPISCLEMDDWQKKGVQVLLKRDDLLFVPSHPEIAGNKWRKMLGTFKAYDRNQRWPLLTQGGLHSNHLVALAAAGNYLGVQTVGLVRGEDKSELSPTCQKALTYGMELHFLSRKEYKALTATSLPPFLKEKYPHFHFIPEGGSNSTASLGLGLLMNELKVEFEEKNLKREKIIVAVPVGTGGTLKGLYSHQVTGVQFLGIYVLKGFAENTLGEDIDLQYNFHLGGYASYHCGLVEFIHDFYLKFHIILDPIYSGKLLFALNELIRTDYFQPGTTVIAIHTGGLQGIAAYNNRYRTELPTDPSFLS
jgi:1-aminocyclopropane-1-carboxylate deaminase